MNRSNIQRNFLWFNVVSVDIVLIFDGLSGNGAIPRFQLLALCIGLLAWCALMYEWVYFDKPRIRQRHKVNVESVIFTTWISMFIFFVVIAFLDLTNLLDPSSTGSRMGLYLGGIGAVATIAGVFLSYMFSTGLDKRLDMRIKQLDADESFSKLAESIMQPIDGIGEPPMDVISIVNRNSFIPGFWIDPFNIRKYGWAEFSKNICIKVIGDSGVKPIRLDLLVPDFKSSNYEEILRTLSQLSVSSILADGVGNNGRRKRVDEGLRWNTAFCSKEASATCGQHNTQAEMPASCSDCGKLKLCRNEEVLQRSAIIRYCDVVKIMFTKLKAGASHRIRIDMVAPDAGFNYPIVMLFDSDLWRHQRSRAVLIVMQKRTIQTGEFVTHLMFPWEVVRGLRGTAMPSPPDPLSQITPVEAQHSKDFLQEVILYHTNLRNSCESELRSIITALES